MEKIPLSQTHQYTILYFYPKDNTPGCTLEAQDFTRLKADFEALDVEIFGVSRDSEVSHENFCTRHDSFDIFTRFDDGRDSARMAKCSRKRACRKDFSGTQRFIKKLAGRLVFWFYLNIMKIFNHTMFLMISIFCFICLKSSIFFPEKSILTTWRHNLFDFLKWH